MTNGARTERFERIKQEAPRLRDLGYRASAIAVYLNVSLGSVYNALRATGNGKWKWGKR